MTDAPEIKTPNGTLIDGVERNRLHPGTFGIPDAAERENLHVGAWCKIGVEPLDDEGGERFWVVVVGRRDDGGYVGSVDNDLVDTDCHGLDYGDLVAFMPQHVLGVL